jgi:hypothetical protein
VTYSNMLSHIGGSHADLTPMSSRNINFSTLVLQWWWPDYNFGVMVFSLGTVRKQVVPDTHVSS